MVTVIKHELRATATMFGSFRPEGWSPRITMVVRGPSPAGAVLTMTVAKPDGSPWFDHTVPLPQLSDGETSSVDLQRWADGVDIAEPGTVGFTVRLVSQLEGVDELLHDGSMTVEALDGEHRFAVNDDWRLTQALLCLDTNSEPDAPPLLTAAYVKGDPEVYRLEAHCFYDGERVATASTVTGRHTFTANDGAVVGHVVFASFDEVRGWNNLADSGWGGDWHLLDAHDGRYEIKLVLENAVVGAIPFTVADGRIVASGAIEADPWAGAAMLVDAFVHEGAVVDDGFTQRPDFAAFYGDAVTAAEWLSIDDVYALRTDRTASGATETGYELQLDPVAAEALVAFFDRAERLIATWETDLTATQPPFDHSQVLTAEAVLREQPGYDERRVAVDSLAPGHPLHLGGEATTLGELRARTDALFTAASARIASAGQQSEDALAPYRALLTGDKLRIFEDRPTHTFEYLTTGGAVISTPEELNDAEYWFFEGPYDVPSTATVDGATIKVTTRGWQMIGWRFDADGTITEEFDDRGPGLAAPRSVYRKGAVI